MSFLDLPPGWAERPVTDPDIFEDAVDLFACQSSREQGCLYLLLCDGRGRVVQPIAIDDWGYDTHGMEQRRVLDRFVGHLAEFHIAHMVIVIARPGPMRATGNDHQTRDAVEHVLADHGIGLLAVALATPLGVRRWLRDVQRRSA